MKRVSTEGNEIREGKEKERKRGKLKGGKGEF